MKFSRGRKIILNAVYNVVTADPLTNKLIQWNWIEKNSQVLSHCDTYQVVFIILNCMKRFSVDPFFSLFLPQEGKKRKRICLAFQNDSVNLQLKWLFLKGRQEESELQLSKILRVQLILHSQESSPFPCCFLSWRDNQQTFFFSERNKMSQRICMGQLNCSCSDISLKVFKSCFCNIVRSSVSIGHWELRAQLSEEIILTYFFLTSTKMCFLLQKATGKFT